jgi:hypothetical protein
MLCYYITIFLVFVFLYASQKSIIKTTDLNNETLLKKTSITKTFFVLVAAILIFVSGFRYYVGTDYSGYLKGFERFASTFWTNLKELDEPGIKFIAKIVTMIGGNATAFIFVCAFITVALF